MKLMSFRTAANKSWQVVEQDLVREARNCLEEHSHFHGHCGSIEMEYLDGNLVLSGLLPSFHLKQLAQEALSELRAPIANQIQVVSSHGLSSTPLHTERS